MLVYEAIFLFFFSMIPQCEIIPINAVSAFIQK